MKNVIRSVSSEALFEEKDLEQLFILFKVSRFNILRMKNVLICFVVLLV